VAQRLTADFGYSPGHAAKAAIKLERLQPAVREAFLTWWRTGVFPPLTVAGYTVQRLVEEYGFVLPGAFLALDWLVREPVQALRALAEGCDEIIPLDHSES
jgi:hypothetical protein